MEDTSTVQVQQERFCKGHILKSATYRNKRDLLMALLQDSKEYTKKEADLLIEQYEKGKVL